MGGVEKKLITKTWMPEIFLEGPIRVTYWALVEMLWAYLPDRTYNPDQRWFSLIPKLPSCVGKRMYEWIKMVKGGPIKKNEFHCNKWSMR
jgi:hypothetical protein